MLALKSLRFNFERFNLLNWESKAEIKGEVSFTRLSINDANKLPEIVLRSGVSSGVNFPETFIFELKNPSTTFAIGKIFFNISIWVKDWITFNLLISKLTSNVEAFPLVDTLPEIAVFPSKISVCKFCKSTFSSFTISFPDTFFKVKLS